MSLADIEDDEVSVVTVLSALEVVRPSSATSSRAGSADVVSNGVSLDKHKKKTEKFDRTIPRGLK